MKQYILNILIFIIGLILGWLNPIEGPLDWTYDEYASQPAHKSHNVAPLISKEKLPILWLFIEEDETLPSSSIIEGVVMEENE